jgi:PBP1b-binding outer membrane lipoprotein LpoB
MKAIITILAVATMFASCTNGTTATTSKVDSTTVDTSNKTVDTTLQVKVDTLKK